MLFAILPITCISLLHFLDAGNPTRSNNTILAVMVEDQNDSPPRYVAIYA